MKTLWTVEVFSEAMVLAETAEEAKRVARGHRRDFDFDYHAAAATSIAPGWEPECTPYGTDDTSITVGQLLQRNRTT